ncbi:MAG: NAD(P)H-hydrate dehydratase [Clostridiaceae bacterium]|nr:NAD(P)H-hydrate dehydratase [Clostridiaceae bacterium]
MKVATPEQMRRIDECAIREYGIPGILLMENAAAAVAAEAAIMVEGRSGSTITIVAGRGNNGGDAFAAARLLHSKGFEVSTYLIGSKDGISADALVNMNILERIGIDIYELTEECCFEGFSEALAASDLIIDGIFGTGLSREVTGLAEAVIGMMNASGVPILSIDIPSGIDGTYGKANGACVNAAATVTFCLPKTGLLLNPGCEHAGRLLTADIGIPPSAISKQDIRTWVIDRQMAASILPVRKPDSNKGDCGRVFIITGSTGMTGSGCLSSAAALRTGAGLIYTGVPASLAPIYCSRLTEPIVIPLEDCGTGCLTASCAGSILERLDRMDAVAVGPGLTVTEDIKKIVMLVIDSCKAPLILDADALNAISSDPSVLKRLKTGAVVTPHPGEMARLMGIGIEEVQADRIGNASRFASEYGVTVVLKGSRTVVAYPDGKAFINMTGNAGMATAGTGDVLTGIIAGIAAQGADAGDAAVAGVYLHGLAGDAAADYKGMYGITAGDLVDFLPVTIKEAVV